METNNIIAERLHIRIHHFRNDENKMVSTSSSTVISTCWSTGKWTLNLIDCEIIHFVRNYRSRHSGEQLISAYMRLLQQENYCRSWWHKMKYNCPPSQKKPQKTELFLMMYVFLFFVFFQQLPDVCNGISRLVSHTPVREHDVEGLRFRTWSRFSGVPNWMPGPREARARVSGSQAACCSRSIIRRDPFASLQVEVAEENLIVMKTQRRVIKSLVIRILNFSSGRFACEQLT